MYINSYKNSGAKERCFLQCFFSCPFVSFCVLLPNLVLSAKKNHTQNETYKVALNKLGRFLRTIEQLQGQNKFCILCVLFVSSYDY